MALFQTPSATPESVLRDLRDCALRLDPLIFGWVSESSTADDYLCEAIEHLDQAMLALSYAIEERDSETEESRALDRLRSYYDEQGEAA